MEASTPTGVRTVVARNAAVSSENRIHEDSTARQYGFTGGLVPGVTLYGYLSGLVVELLGGGWLEQGWVSMRFRRPVYDGATVELSARPVDDALELFLTDAEGQPCVTGRAGLGEGRPSDARSTGVADEAGEPLDQDWARGLRIPLGELPEERPPASASSLAPGTVLGSLWEETSSSRYRHYEELLEPGAELCRRDSLVHPGRLVLSANTVLAANVVLGPWVHVGTELVNLAPVCAPAVVETRAVVAELFERQGHQFVTLNVAWMVDGDRVAAARHTAIYQLRAPGAP